MNQFEKIFIGYIVLGVGLLIFRMLVDKYGRNKILGIVMMLSYLVFLEFFVRPKERNVFPYEIFFLGIPSMALAISIPFREKVINFQKIKKWFNR
ncbi:MAG: hypothetical protein KC478_15720 [Bacteriovoracaceae bacterium]|nr:hypothetical protein [Bacteriovoracaceae bacterium]